MENNANANAINPKLSAGEEPKSNNETQQQERDGEEEENPNSASATNGEATSHPSSRRTPFTTLSQVDAELAVALTLQEQERTYMMLRMGNSGTYYGGWAYYDDHVVEEEEEEEDGDEDDDFEDPGLDGEDDGDEEVEYNGMDADDDAFDVLAHTDGRDEEESNSRAEVDPAGFDSDEAYARALQDAEERDMTARLFALARIHDLNDRETEDVEGHGGNSQDTWEVDPDELSYEELLALGEVVGTESRGLSADTIASLPSINYKIGSSQNGSNDSCVICRLDYEDGETLILLSCKHSYHSECINNWLKINKVCPVCRTEVST